MSLKLFGPTYDLLGKVLDLRSQRHTMISSNIANADTPNYKAVRINFEDELKKAMPRGNKLRLNTTNAMHVPHNSDFRNIEPEVYQDKITVQRADGNTVDVDKEIVDMSKNQLMYNTVTQILARRFKGLLNAIKEAK